MYPGKTLEIRRITAVSNFSANFETSFNTRIDELTEGFNKAIF